MPDRLLMALGQARRKLLLARAGEAAAVAAAAAGLSAAGVEFAWTIGYRWPAAGLTVCLLLMVIAALALVLPPLWPPLRRVLPSLQDSLSPALPSAAVAAFGAMGVWQQWMMQESKFELALVAMVGGAVVAFAARMARGLTLRQTAVYLDHKAELHERLVTAVELAHKACAANEPGGAEQDHAGLGAFPPITRKSSRKSLPKPFEATLGHRTLKIDLSSTYVSKIIGQPQTSPEAPAELPATYECPSLASVIYQQAMDAMEHFQPQHMPMWRRTRATAAALALAIAACAVLATLPIAGLSPGGAEVAAFADAVPALSASQRKELSDSFRKAAAAAAKDPILAARLAKAARLIDARNTRELEKVLAKLQADGYQMLDPVPGHLLAALAPTGADAGSSSGRSPKPSPQGIATAAAPARPSHADGNGAVVRVYNPAYDKLPTPIVDAGSEADSRLLAAPPVTSATSPASIEFADAWSAARRSAGDALAQDKIPPQYRQLVRDYFAE